jgi:hypothetical protein
MQVTARKTISVIPVKNSSPNDSRTHFEGTGLKLA